jgi:ectoine hydroxylase-related dioxygenase (phytanoyl-CoA dioxygenase family)
MTGRHHPHSITGEPLTEVERAAFERDGYLALPGVLGPTAVQRYEELVSDTYERWRRDAGTRRAMHQLSAVNTCPALAALCSHPRILGAVWPILGWNVHVYHSHVDVHPPEPDAVDSFAWHQDGGRQNRELETEPRPRMSVKVAYWLSDLSESGRGNLRVVPGSHRVNRIDGPPARDTAWPDPPGAVEIRANAGDALLFDRRLWHARSINRSATTRKAVFFAYTYRWVLMRDTAPTPDARYTAVERQLLDLLDDIDGDHAWGHDPSRVPLHGLLTRAGMLGGAALRAKTARRRL